MNPQDADGENVYSIEVTVTDTSGLSDTQSIALTVTNVPEAPSITSASTRKKAKWM